MGDIMELNQIPVKTTNNFNINNLKIDLNLPTEFSNNDYLLKNTDKIKINKRYDSTISKIGLTFKKALTLDITIDKIINDDIEFTYNFDNSDLISNINIHFLENSKANIIFKYISTNQEKHFNHTKFNIILDKQAEGNICILNFLNKNSTNIIASESKLNEYSILTQNLIDTNGNIRIYNIYSEANNYAKSFLNNIYIGKNNDLIDMNYHLINKGIKSITNINVEGVLNNKAIKNFRGTIDFISGASESIGKEKENCVLLSDQAISKSVPLLLCGEENVEGAHAVATGKPDLEKIFYLMTKGFSEKEAMKLIIFANFYKILDSLKNKEEIIKVINKRI